MQTILTPKDWAENRKASATPLMFSPSSRIHCYTRFEGNNPTQKADYSENDIFNRKLVELGASSPMLQHFRRPSTGQNYAVRTIKH